MNILQFSACLKRHSKSKLLYFFFDFWSNFWYPRKYNCLLFGNAVIIIIVDTTCFLFKAINYLLQCLSIMPLFGKYLSQMFYFCPQIFFRTDFCSSRKKSFKYAGNCVRGYTRMWLNLHVRQSWFVVDIKFISPIVIFYFYVQKVQTFFFIFIFYGKLNVFVLFV